MKNRIRENFYHKYFNLVGSKATAQNLIKEQAEIRESRKESSMTLPFKLNLNKTTLAWAGVAVIVLALALGIYFTRGPGGILNNALAAHLSIADGQVEIWNGSEWKPVRAGVTLADQSQIRTGEASKAVLEFDEGSALRLDENTHVILEKIDNNLNEAKNNIDSAEAKYKTITQKQGAGVAFGEGNNLIRQAHQNMKLALDNLELIIIKLRGQ